MFDFDVVTGPGPLAALAEKEAEKITPKQPTVADLADKSAPTVQERASRPTDPSVR
jgi:hypothetical protein